MSAEGVLVLESTSGNLNLSQYLNVQEGEGMDPADPSFTEKVFAHSLLKQGGTLALENFKLREQVYPVLLNTSDILRVNPIPNPSFEYDASGSEPAAWVTNATYRIDEGATAEVVHASGVQTEGRNSYCHVVTAGATSAEGIDTGEVIPAETDVPVTVYVPLFGPEGGGQKVELRLGSAAAGGKVGKAVTLVEGWKLYSVTFTPTGNGLMGFAVCSQGTGKLTFDIAAVSTVAPYFDGDTPGYHWSGTPGNSTSMNYVGKDGLTALVRELNTIINTAGCTVSWQDTGATEPTYFQLSSGEFDIEFKYRRSENNWLGGKLRLFVQPFGYYSKLGAHALTVSGIATNTAAATSPVVTFPASAVLKGDAPALIQAQVIGKSVTSSLYAAISLLPSASYIPFVGAATLGAGNAVRSSYIADTLAPGGTAIHLPNPVGNEGFEWTAPATIAVNAYAGNQRILVIARTPTSAAPIPLQLRGELDNEALIGATVAPVATAAWQLLDFGIKSGASYTFAIGERYRVALQVRETTGASRAIDVAGIIQLPEDSTCWLNPLLRHNSSEENYVVFDGLSNSVQLMRELGVGASGTPDKIREAPLTDVTGEARGAIPGVPATPLAPVFAALAVNHPFQPNGVPRTWNKQTLLRINVLERARYVF